MASASSSASFFSIAESNHHQIQPQPQSSTTLSSSATTASGSQQPSTAAGPPQKKKRNQPGNPNPDAEVIALSPKTLMATNRFVCEVCNKGFQREQNLQLHRRGHNLPWKLKQKSTKEVRRKVYLCPEPTCVHHEPSRALGDLTGIKKHFCRKHGEKKWKCEKCSKRYAVQSDWKAHSKTCGTREYRCDCGTLFSRRDSFITHRAFCDALAQESARLPTNLNTIGLFSNTNNINLGFSQVNPGHLDQGPAASSAADLLRLGAAAASAPHFDHFLPQRSPSSSAFYLSSATSGHDFQEEHPKPFHGLMHNAAGSSSASVSAAASLFNLSFCGTTSNNANNVVSNPNNSGFLMADQANAEPMTLFAGTYMGDYTEPMQLPQMSATALLQKAAQMGSTTSGGSGAAAFGGITRAQMENEANLQDLMNSLANGNAGIFDGFGHHQGLNEMDHHPHESKLHQSLMGGGSDGLTRDFLGVGSVVRGLGGGLGQRDQNQMGSLNSGSTGGSRSFGGGALQ